MGENFGEKIKRNVEKFGWLVSGGGDARNSDQVEWERRDGSSMQIGFRSMIGAASAENEQNQAAARHYLLINVVLENQFMAEN